MPLDDAKEPALVVCQTAQGMELRGSINDFNRHRVVFEIYSPGTVLRTSEVLNDFRIFLQDHNVYYGRATIINLVTTATMLMCEASLEDGWQDPELLAAPVQRGGLKAAFDNFVHQWQKTYRILPQYKTVVTDMQSFLADLRLWVEQVEVGIRSHPSGDRIQLEKELAHNLADLTVPMLTPLFEKFEQAAVGIEPELMAAHRSFSRRQLHPLLLCAPFLYRTFQKPLGYAGDYEMVNMILRDPLEGGSLFAKIINVWFLRQPPAEAHRNRVNYLARQITECAAAAKAAGRKARILSLGCGPAQEVQLFLTNGALAEAAEFTLIDFNAETLSHVQGIFETLKTTSSPRASVQLVKKSVNQLLKEAGRTVDRSPEARHDLVYCAGLFDYLSDQVCHRLSNILFDWLAPGGLFISTNVDNSNPRRTTMEFIMEWHLNYRSGQGLAKLKPDRAADDRCRISSDSTGVNLYFEARNAARG